MQIEKTYSKQEKVYNRIANTVLRVIRVRFTERDES